MRIQQRKICLQGRIAEMELHASKKYMQHEKMKRYEKNKWRKSRVREKSSYELFSHPWRKKGHVSSFCLGGYRVSREEEEKDKKTGRRSWTMTCDLSNQEWSRLFVF